MKHLSRILPYGFAIGHRGFTAGSNIVLTIIAGRTLEVTEFGVLALFMAIIGLVMIFHSSLFSEPMLVYGPRDFNSGLRRYFIALLGTQLGFGIFCAVVGSLFGLILGNLSYVIFSLAIPFALSLDFQDRSFFMQMRPHVPFISSLVQFVTICGLLFGVIEGFENTLASFLWIYISSLATANIFSAFSHAFLWSSFGCQEVDHQDIMKRHFRFASWSLISHFMLFLVTNFYIFLLPILQDLFTTANFRAQAALTGAGAQAFSALGLVAVPMLRTCETRGAYLDRLKTLLLVITTVGVAVALTLGVWGEEFLNLVYGGKYGMLPIGYWLAGLFPVSIGYAFMMGSALRALDRADLAAKSSGVAALTCLPLGVWLTLRFGTEGVILSQVLGSLTMAVCCAFFLKRLFTDTLIEEN